VGSFRRVECRALVTYDTPRLSGMDRFRTTVAAVRSAHVLVAVHGAGAVNAFFLRGTNRSAAALLEVRPCGFGSGFTWWVDVHMAINLPRLGDQVRPASCMWVRAYGTVRAQRPAGRSSPTSSR
jgi:hypothetical protein